MRLRRLLIGTKTSVVLPLFVPLAFNIMRLVAFVQLLFHQCRILPTWRFRRFTLEPAKGNGDFNNPHFTRQSIARRELSGGSILDLADFFTDQIFGKVRDDFPGNPFQN